MQRVEVTQRAAACTCERTCPRFRRSILLSAMRTGLPRSKTRRATKRSPAPIRACVHDEQDCVDVLERGVDGLLHALRQRVEGLLEAWEVDERELVARPVRDAESLRRVVFGTST